MAVLNPPTPQHTHDCDECILIANLGTDDLYVCNEGGADILNSRFGSYGPDYASVSIEDARYIAVKDTNYDLRVRLYDAFLAGRNSL